MELPSDNICERCGRFGHHPECERALAEAALRTMESDYFFIFRCAMYGVYGVAGPQSRQSLDQAILALETSLGRPLDYNPYRLIENEDWWFIPENWIGMTGFIIEKKNNRIFPLGSGLAALSDLRNTYDHWCAINEFMSGNVQPI